ncbi:MAG: hypothetical protein ACRDO4_11670 [Nocardioides sp.]
MSTCCSRTRRSSCSRLLAFWDDVLPAMPEEMVREHLRVVAESLAADSGTAFPES